MKRGYASLFEFAMDVCRISSMEWPIGGFALWGVPLPGFVTIHQATMDVLLPELLSPKNRARAGSKKRR